MTEFARSNDPGWGVLVANLGTPAAPERGAVARFLREFLSDPRVVDLPRWLWLPLLHGIIVPLRAPRSAHAYARIWSPEGSPLLVLTVRLAQRLGAALGEAATVITGMRYGEPSLLSALDTLHRAGVERLVVLPLYPQYSATTTESIHDGVTAALKQLCWQPQVLRVNDYHNDPAWVRAVARSILDFRARSGDAERLLFSLHGIPQRYVANGDPYAQQCRASVDAIAAAAGLRADEWQLCFQSRVGREPWLQPYTDLTLRELAGQGVRHVQVVCPGFAVDCLETLEEIAMQNREGFIACGGERLDYIPALNDSEAHVIALKQIVARMMAGQAQ